MLNIHHIHFNNFGDEVRVDAVYMEQGETMEDHMEFKIDNTGNKLNYKILVKDNQIEFILHNGEDGIDQVPFDEIKLAIGDKVTVDGHKLGEAKLLAEIVDFPVAMLVCSKRHREFVDTIEPTKVKFPMHGDCNHRFPDDLPGYIDMLVLSNDGGLSFNENPDKISVTHCHCE